MRVVEFLSIVARFTFAFAL